VELRRAGFEAAEDGWDLVVSNPPYVHHDELPSLQVEVRDWEPSLALVGHGLHEELAARADTKWLVLEVGDGQAPAVARAVEALGYDDVRITTDLTGVERVVEGRRRRA
jgi:release factor glutamine methyltransferase